MVAKVPQKNIIKKDKTGDILFIVEREHSHGFNGSPAQRDTIRFVLGSCWKATNLPSELPTNMVDARPILRKNTQKNHQFYEIKHAERKGNKNDIIVENITIRSRNVIDMNHERTMMSAFLKTFPVSATNSRTFEDHACDINTYEKKSNKSEETSGVINLYMKVAPEYNYQESEYEMRAEAELDEKVLPNFYNIMFNGGDFDFSEDKKENTSTSLLNLYGLIHTPVVKKVDVNLNPISRYINSWTNAWASLTPESKERVSFETEKMKRTYFTKEEVEKMNSLAKFSQMMPMFTRIQFQTEFESGIGAALAETNYAARIRDFISTTQPLETPTYEVMTRVAEGGIFLQNFTNETSTPPIDNIGLESRAFYDVDDFFKNHLDQNARDSFYFSDSTPTQDSDRYRAYFTLMTAIAKAKIEKIKKEKVRSYLDILDGKKAHSETLMYTIRKYDTAGNLIQSFYFTNSDKVSNIDFIDSQVKYNKTYKYELSAIKLVVGTRYTQELLEDDGTNMTFRVISRPSVKLVEVGLVDDEALIMDNPPLPPEFYPVPLHGVNNRIRFMLNSSVGRAMMKPVIFTSEEQRDIDIFRKAQKTPKDQEEIMFETDDGISEFEIYRLDTKPKSIEQFYAAGKRVVSKTIFDDTNFAVSSSLEDKVKPNIKYYYIARAMDAHAHMSNPTIIWQIEIVSQGGASYPVMKEYMIEEADQLEPKKSLKRFIQIAPANLQKMVNDSASNISSKGPKLNQSIVLSRAESSIWGKKFKLRLTSKATGKKVDFNFTFDVKNRILVRENNEGA